MCNASAWECKECISERYKAELFRKYQDLFCLVEGVQRGLSFSCLGFFNLFHNPFPKHYPKQNHRRETWGF